MAVLFFITIGAIACIQHFALTLPKMSTSAPIHTDGLVVATGGQQRISEGLRLIEQGVSENMLITGVGPGISTSSLQPIFANSPVQKEILECCVELDSIAMDTVGNAQAAKQWATKHGHLSISLVTANYHMPRALLLFKRAMPHINIHPLPIFPPDLQPDKWYANWPTAKLLSKEYAKYLVALLNL